MENFRTEKDSLGELKISADSLWGIHTQRALGNFPNSGFLNYNFFYKALSQVKLAAALTNQELGFLDKNISQAIIQALQEMIEGKFFDHFVVDPLQGGAGTSTNMNINEIAANRANNILGEKIVDPLAHLNLHQSTNDVYPTALKVAAYYFLQELEKTINELLQVFQQKEKETGHIVKLGRTELMPAVPYTMGKHFSAFAECLARDRWRISKCTERIRQVNLGGTAIGTGITAPKQYIFRVNEKLKELTGVPIARAENLIDATQNHDQIAEVFAMVKVLALDLEKISNDLRLMAMLGEIDIPAVQAGSSIMPGKYNPVILEMVSTIAKKVIGNELTASLAIAKGELELNAFLPLVAHTLFESCDLLRQAIDLLIDKCIDGITVHETKCMLNFLTHPTSTTILVPEFGYQKASEVAEYMQKNSVDLKKACAALNIMTETALDVLLTPERLNAIGS